MLSYLLIWKGEVFKDLWHVHSQPEVCIYQNSSTSRYHNYASRHESGGASSSSHEAEGDRELSSAEMTARGRRPRDVNVRGNFQSRSPSAKCCELYASLHDCFRLEVRILFYPMSTWKLAA